MLSCGSQSDESLTETLRGQDGVVFLGEAADPESSESLLKSCMPEVAVVIMDGSVTGCLKLVAKLTRSHDVPILVVSSHDERLYAERALRVGARGYLMANASPEALMKALRTVRGGDVCLSERVRSRLWKDLAEAGHLDGEGVGSRRRDQECRTNRSRANARSTRSGTMGTV